ncbi:MAG: hypothetical protein KBB83_00305 [Alphaproteobacteria bacterium]|nr:hypothetical protein [Alphaproteobacteria bacterium]
MNTYNLFVKSSVLLFSLFAIHSGLKASKLVELVPRVSAMRASPHLAYPSETMAISAKKISKKSLFLTVIRVEQDFMAPSNLALYDSLSSLFNSGPTDLERAREAYNQIITHKIVFGTTPRKAYDDYRYAHPYPILIQVPDHEFIHFKERLANFMKDAQLHPCLLFHPYEKKYEKEYCVSHELNGSDYYLRPYTGPFQMAFYNRQGENVFSRGFFSSHPDKPATDLLIPALYGLVKEYNIQGAEYFLQALLKGTSFTKMRVDGRRYWDLSCDLPEKRQFNWRVYDDVREQPLRKMRTRD